MRKFTNLGDLPPVSSAEYSTVPQYPLFGLKYAQQVQYSSGFDSTWRIQLYDQLIDPEAAEKPFHAAAQTFEASFLSDFADLDAGFAEEIASGSCDAMSDAFYVRLHAPLEVVERLHDHNKSLSETAFYAVVDRFADAPAAEDQYYKTLSPLQTYLKPVNIVLQQPYMACRFTNMDYQYQTYQDRVITCVYPNFRKEKLAPAEQKYCQRILDDSAAEFSCEVVYRQKSAHELWTRIIAAQAGVELVQSVADAYYSVVEDYNLEFKKMLARLENIFSAEEGAVHDRAVAQLSKYVPEQAEARRALESLRPYATLEARVIDRIMESAEYIIQQPQCTFSLEHELVFEDSYDVTIRGLVESKSSNNPFFTLLPQQKKEFLAPLIAERVLTYQKAGLYSKMVQTRFVAPKKECQCHLRALGSLSSKFLVAFRRQHNYILQQTLLEMQVDQLVSCDTWMNGGSAAGKTLFLLRPVCGCYGCNLAATYDSDSFDYSARIYGGCRIRQQKIKAEDVLHNIFERQAYDLNRQIPYFKTIIRDICDRGMTFTVLADGEYAKYSMNREQPNCIDWGYKNAAKTEGSLCQSEMFDAYVDVSVRGKPAPPQFCRKCEYLSKGVQHWKKGPAPVQSDSDLVCAVLVYAYLLPPHIHYGMSYAINVHEFPSVVFDQQFIRNDFIQCFSKNPHLMIYHHIYEKEDSGEFDEAKEGEGSGDLRMQPMLQSYLVDRYHESLGGASVEPHAADIAKWSTLQLYLNVYGSQNLEEIDWLEENPTDIDYRQRFTVRSGKILTKLSSTATQKKISKLFIGRRKARKNK